MWYGGMGIWPGDASSFMLASDSFIFDDANFEWPHFSLELYLLIIPEPTAGLLALIGAATLLLRRRKMR